MISVCIPVFNVDVRMLAETLSSQAADLTSEGIPIQIIFLDDGSGAEYRALNQSLHKAAKDFQGSFIYQELENNIGRSAIRNRFIEYASHPNLLFMDCDSGIPTENYLRDYADAVQKYPDSLVCGGRIYPPDPPARNRRLHWKYGILKESQPAEVRKKDPNRSFMTNNFLIPVKLLKEILFEERLSGYGHEDSLFGYELLKKGEEIIHIENPVIHEGLETNREFTVKTSQAIRNLVLITKLNGNDPGFKETIKLIRTAENIKSRGLGMILRISTAVLNPIFKCMLKRGFTNLRLLDMYKLGTYLREESKSA